jgi:hypothetical protein
MEHCSQCGDESGYRNQRQKERRTIDLKFAKHKKEMNCSYWCWELLAAVEEYKELA